MPCRLATVPPSHTLEYGRMTEYLRRNLEEVDLAPRRLSGVLSVRQALQAPENE